jgi:FkbM family methyltransferase
MQTNKKLLLAKFLSFILLKIFKFKVTQIVARKDINYKLNLRQGIDLSIFIFGSFQSKITSILTKIILNKKNQKFFSVLDIGSNIGDKSLSLAKNLLNKKIKNFLIYSIEPTEFAINKQIENLNLNKELKKKIRIFTLFITNTKNNIKEAFSSWDLFKKNNIIHGGQKKLFSKNTKSISLDNFIKNNKIKNVLLIKIDVDGNELDVLYSAKKFLLKNSPYIIIEFSQSALEAKGVSINNFYKFIKNINYSIYDLNLKKITKNIPISINSSIDVLLVKNSLC